MKLDNPTLRTIAARNSCRDFDGSPVDPTALEAIALAGVQSPSAMNLQPWRIIVITDGDLIREIDDAGMAFLASQEDKSGYQRMMERGGKLFYNAPCLIVVAIDPQHASAPLDCGIVCENMSLAASSLGLGNVICGMAGIPFSGEKGDYFKKKAGFPEGWNFGMSLVVGNAVTGKEPHEPDLSKISYI